MKSIVLLMALLSGTIGLAQSQEIYLKSFVKKDTIQLRWSALNATLLARGLKEGYTITRYNQSAQETSEWDILPFEDRKEALLQSPDTITVFMVSVVDEFLNNNQVDKTQKQSVFFMLSLASSTNRNIANVLGLYHEDIGLPKASYKYGIRFSDENEARTFSTVKSSELSRNPDFSDLQGSSRTDLKEVYLKWEARSLNADYGGYWVLKSEDGTNFNRLSATPQYFITSQYEKEKDFMDFVDKEVEEGKTYYYQVEPINHFGDMGERSEVVEVYIQKRLTGTCIIDTVESKDFTRIIQGKYVSQQEQSASGFVLMRADKIDSTYTIIETKNSSDNSFVFEYETNLLSGDRHYFKVAALSEDGDTAMSFPYYYFTLDQEPPGPPVDFTGEINENGVASLKWSPPGDNDIQGYRIFRANSLNEEFVEITTYLSADTFYFDTLALDNLTSEIYYKMKSVDLNYNNSQATPVLPLVKPDTIAPVPSVIKKYRVVPKGIEIEWANSQSTDLENQLLIRFSGSKADTVLQFKNEYKLFLDSNCIIGKRYEYQIITSDISQNKSMSNTIPVVFETGYRSAVENLKAEVFRDEKKIKIIWDSQSAEPVYSIQIYRAKNDEKFKLYRTIRKPVSQFEDDRLSVNNTYSYRIKVTYKSGKSTRMSDAVQITY